MEIVSIGISVDLSRDFSCTDYVKTNVVETINY